MNSKRGMFLTLFSVVMLFSMVSTVSGLVIEEIVFFHDMDVNGHPIEQLDFYQDTDVVMLWVNMTDIHVNDTITFEWQNPAGEMYTTQEWIAPSWIETTPSYSMFEEIEIMGDPAENMLGMWNVKISIGDEWHWWSFSLNGGTADGSSATVSTDYMAITDVTKPTSYTPGENVTLTITVDYSYTVETAVAPSVWNNNTWTFIATVEDTLVGTGTKTYDLEFMADEAGTAYYAIAYFVEDENIIYDENHGIVPFVLESDGDQSTIPSLDKIDLPSNIDVDEIKNQINDYIGYGLDFIENIEVPDELKDVEDTIKEKTGIPGYPVDSILVGTALLGLYLRRRKSILTQQ